MFGCGTYVYIPNDVQVNKLTPRAEVMVFLGYSSGTKGFKFMRKPKNVIFHGVTAMFVFDKHMFPSCPDNISPGSTCIGANYPGTEFDIPLEDGGWFDGGAIPPSGPYPSAGGIPPQQGPPNSGPQQPLVGPPNPPVVPLRPPVVPAGAPQPSIQPPAPSSSLRNPNTDAIARLFREMLVIGTAPENQQNFGVDPTTGRALDTLGYHPVQNPNPNPFSSEEPGFESNPIPPAVPAPTTFLLNRNNQGLRGFTIPMGHGLAWEQQLHDTLQAQYQRNQPAQPAGPPPALEEQDPSGSMQPRQSSRV